MYKLLLAYRTKPVIYKLRAISDKMITFFTIYIKIWEEYITFTLFLETFV